MENIYLNETILKVFPNGEVWKFGYFRNTSKEQTWYPLRGTIATNEYGYKQHRTNINYKYYITARLLAYAFLRFDLEETEDTIDHISRNSLDNHISNLRCTSRREQALNKNCVIQAKGWHLKRGRYCAQIMINNKTIHLGNFKTKEEAHQAYLQAVASRT